MTYHLKDLEAEYGPAKPADNQRLSEAWAELNRLYALYGDILDQIDPGFEGKAEAFFVKLAEGR
jgi:hypothetical protein